VRRLARPLLYVGTVGIVLALARIHAQFIGHYVFHASDRLPWTIAYAVLMCLSAYGVGLPDGVRGWRSETSSALAAAVGGAVAISAIQLALGSLLLPRFVVFLGALSVVPWYVACAELAQVGHSRESRRDRVVAVVSSDEAEALRKDMAGASEKPATLVAVLSSEEACSSGPTSKPLIEVVLRSGGSVVVLNREAQGLESVVAQAATLHESGVRVRTVSFFYDEWLGKLAAFELERMSLMFDVGELHRLRYGRGKRLSDLVVGTVGAILLILALPFVLVGNLVANRGSLFYRQPRVGRANEVYEIYKFRTMRPSGTAPEWTVEGDGRITPFGRWLRRTHLDELPQVLNILQGSQSTVGPRPEQPQYVEELRQKIPFYDLRHLVRPGLTGWAQVKYDYGSTELDALEKLQYEFYYLRHQSLTLDLRIIGRTLRSVIGRSGR
jgi:lipopolysaccharide/colanic/teichoic acid biosynthesis glycosyltransferase